MLYLLDIKTMMNNKTVTLGRSGLAVFFTMILGSQSLAVTTGITSKLDNSKAPLLIDNSLKSEFLLSQQPAPPKANSNSEREKLEAQVVEMLKEAATLQQQGTTESLKKALQKYEELLQLGRKISAPDIEFYAIKGIGNVYADKNEYQKAIENLNQSLEIIIKLGNPIQKGYNLMDLGSVYSNLWEKQKALDHYNQALSIFRAEKKPDLEATTLFFIAAIYSDLGETKKTLELFKEILAINKNLNNYEEVAKILTHIASVYQSSGDKNKAIDYLNQALEIQKTRKDISGQIRTLNSLGGYYSSEQPQKSLTIYNQALELHKQSGNQDGFAQALTFMGLGSTYYVLGDFQQSLNSLNQARTIFQKSNLFAQEAKVLSMIANIYSSRGETEKALESLASAQKLTILAKDSSGEADVLRKIGDIYKDKDDYQQALDNYTQVLDIKLQIKDVPYQAFILNKIADTYLSLGDYKLSVDTHNQSLEIFKKIGDNKNVLLTLNSIGIAYNTAKDYSQALEYYQQALNLSEKTREYSSQYVTFLGMIQSYHALKDYPNALEKAEQALSLANKNNNSYYQATFLGYKAMVYQSMGKSQEALPLAQQAIEINKKLDIPPAQANALYDLGDAYKALKQYADAVAAYKKELALREKMSDRTGMADTLYRIAQTEREKGDINAARQQIEGAIEIVENIRTKVTSQDLRTSYLAKFQKYYQFYIDLMMEAHKQQPSKGYDILALQASERSSARSLLEILNEANADIRTGVDPQLITQERNLQQKLDANEKRRIEMANKPNSSKQEEALKQETTNLLAEYRQIQAKIRATSPRYASLTQPQPLTLTEIQQQVLDENTLLLKYSLGEKQSYLWLISDTGMNSYELPKSAEIEELIKKFRNEIVKPTSTKKAVAKAAKPLTEILLNPIASQLGKKRLVIVGDGALQYLPYAALSIPNLPEDTYKPLIVNHEIITLPSASTLAILRREQKNQKPATKTLALLADPVFTKDDERLKIKKEIPSNNASFNLNNMTLKRAASNTETNLQRLPFTRKEAETILQLVPENQRLQAYDFAANRDFATNQQLSQYRILHFATHGIMNSQQPELSGIVLSLFDQQGNPQNGFLRLHDIFNLNLSAELVVLSACQTGLGQEIKGEGLVGLTRGFMYAGSPRVVVSLWNVDDQATSLLMQKFYQKMLKDGLKPAAALRQAQIEMLENENFSKPDYWAAFTLQGEWR